MITGFTCSTFDLLHAGHIAMLAEARSQCDYLVVGLQSDPTIDRPDTKQPPIQSLFERFVQLDAVKYVGKVVPYSTEKELIDILLTYPIDVRILGNEYQGKEFTGKGLVKEYFNSRKHSFSSTDLRLRVLNAEMLDA